MTTTTTGQNDAAYTRIVEATIAWRRAAYAVVMSDWDMRDGSGNAAMHQMMIEVQEKAFAELVSARQMVSDSDRVRAWRDAANVPGF